MIEQAQTWAPSRHVGRAHDLGVGHRLTEERQLRPELPRHVEDGAVVLDDLPSTRAEALAARQIAIVVEGRSQFSRAVVEAKAAETCPGSLSWRLAATLEG